MEVKNRVYTVGQHTPTPEQFLRFIKQAIELEDKDRGLKRIKNGTKKLLEQLDLDNTLNNLALTELAARGYSDAVKLLLEIKDIRD